MPWTSRLRGFRIRGQGRAAQWIATADEISGRIALLALVAKSFRASGVEGEGVVFRLRCRRDRFSHLFFPPELSPPIPGLRVWLVPVFTVSCPCSSYILTVPRVLWFAS